MIIDYSKDCHAECTICGDRAKAPLLQWFCKTSIIICSTCCGKVAHGLIADLIAMKAKDDIEQLTGRRGLHVCVRPFDSVLAEREAIEAAKSREICKAVDDEDAKRKAARV